MSAIHRLVGSAYGIHLADQIALVAIPLVAALVFEASPAVIGLLVACQSASHLLASIPFGVLVDRSDLRGLVRVAALLSLVGFVGAAAGVFAGVLTIVAIFVTLAGFGTVLFGLAALSILPRLTDATGLARANARIELPRAICSFAVPLLIGLLAGLVPAWCLFALASIGALMAWGVSSGLPTMVSQGEKPVIGVQDVLDGGRFAWRHDLLRPIALCSIFWNLAFAALLVVMVPVIQSIYGLDPGVFGIAMSCFGGAAILGSWISSRVSHVLAPSIVLVFGPGSSVLSVLFLVQFGAGTPGLWVYVAFFLLGFGPSMWLVAQNSVRQLVTPPEMLGRVNAVIQTAIYGVRPLGAVLGGFVAGHFGLTQGLALVFVAFSASFAVSVFSALRNVSSFADLTRFQPQS